MACAMIFSAAFQSNCANATEYCELISGDGRSLGSEIACGDEHFYIIDSANDSVRALAKYNLNVGITKYKTKASGENYDEIWQFCENLRAEMGYPRMEPHYSAYVPGASECWLLKPTRNDGEEIHQLEEARSAHWDADGNYLYPQIGDVFIYDQAGIAPGNTTPVDFDFGALTDTIRHFIDEGSSDYYPNQGLEDYRLNLKPNSNRDTNEVASSVYEYMNGLNNAGYDILGASLLTMNDLNQIAGSEGRPFDYAQWNNTSDGTFSIAQYFNEEDSWLWDRTYWLRTGNLNSSYSRLMLFVDAKGEICSTSFGDGGQVVHNCSTRLKTSLDTGVRPLLTINNIFKYHIVTDNSDGSEIEVADTALGNDEVVFDVSPKAGYKLVGLTLVTGTGETIELSSADIEDGSFVMPFANITIRAKWQSDSDENTDDENAESDAIDVNPNTSNNTMSFFLAVIASVVILDATMLALRRR